MSRGCQYCTVTTDARNRQHHDPRCREMFWRDGTPRGVTPAAELARFGPLGSGLTLGEEMSQISAGVQTVNVDVEELP